MVNILKDKLVKSRKPHRCWMCGRVFPVGTEMHYQVNTYEERLNTVYTCVTCQELLSHFQIEDACDGFEEYFITETLDAVDFKGTPEEYLELKRAERLAKMKFNENSV